jgi:hypothetical protein
MCIPKPKAPDMPAPPPEAPRESDASVQRAAADQRRRAAAANGAASTILTGPSGAMTPPQVTSKSLLGG